MPSPSCSTASTKHSWKCRGRRVISGHDDQVVGRHDRPDVRQLPRPHTHAHVTVALVPGPPGRCTSQPPFTLDAACPRGSVKNQKRGPVISGPSVGGGVLLLEDPLRPSLEEEVLISRPCVQAISIFVLKKPNKSTRNRFRGVADPRGPRRMLDLDEARPGRRPEHQPVQAAPAAFGLEPGQAAGGHTGQVSLPGGRLPDEGLPGPGYPQRDLFPCAEVQLGRANRDVRRPVRRAGARWRVRHCGPMAVKEVAAVVLKAGHKSKNRALPKTVGKYLAAMPGVQKVGHGTFRAS